MPRVMLYALPKIFIAQSTRPFCMPDNKQKPTTFQENLFLWGGSAQPSSNEMQPPLLLLSEGGRLWDL